MTECIWCGRDFVKGLKKYCQNCADHCVKECSRCHRPFPSLSYFPHPISPTCHACTRIYAKQKAKRMHLYCDTSTIPSNHSSRTTMTDEDSLATEQQPSPPEDLEQPEASPPPPRPASAPPLQRAAAMKRKATKPPSHLFTPFQLVGSNADSGGGARGRGRVLSRGVRGRGRPAAVVGASRIRPTKNTTPASGSTAGPIPGLVYDPMKTNDHDDDDDDDDYYDDDDDDDDEEPRANGTNDDDNDDDDTVRSERSEEEPPPTKRPRRKRAVQQPPVQKKRRVIPRRESKRRRLEQFIGTDVRGAIDIIMSDVDFISKPDAISAVMRDGKKSYSEGENLKKVEQIVQLLLSYADYIVGL